MKARLISVFAVCLLLSVASNAVAQSNEPIVPIEEAVARALFERATVLFGRGEIANAKQLFIESLHKSSDGIGAEDARRMIRTCNERLGVSDLEDGIAAASSQPVPVDPYAGRRQKRPAGSGDARVDSTTPPATLPPVIGAPGLQRSSRPTVASVNGDPRIARWGLTGWAGGFGLSLGLAAFGPTERDTDGTDGVAASAVLAGLAAGGLTSVAAYWLNGRFDLDGGQSSAIATAGTWGMVSFALMGDAATGTDSESNDVFKIMALGGILATGGGVYYAATQRPTVGDVALMNSFAAYGTSAGLLLGVMISPPTSEAYSLNAFFGSITGLAAGALLSRRVSMTRQRSLWLDLGAAAGVATAWGLIYPLLYDTGTNNDEQTAGLVSTLALGGGVATAWLLTRNMEDGDARARGPSAGALLTSSEARWRWGIPLPQPMRTSDGVGAIFPLLRVGDE